MPAPPTSSSAGRSRTQTPMSYEKFRPKFPVNPFVRADQTPASTRDPWSLDIDNLPLPSILQHERRVILVIGQATAAALSPLFASRQLSSSLLIIASHRPPALPFDTQPSVYTLRLRTPLAVADAGATRLIEVLEWALQVARIWRRSGGPKKQELMEEVSPGSDSVPLGQSFGRLRYSVARDVPQEQTSASSAFSPTASVTSLTPPKRPRRLSLFRRQSSMPQMPDPASVKPFDALLHFLPADAPEKTLLKAMILVTTLTRPYLAAPPTRVRTRRFYSESSSKLSTSSIKSGKRWSFFRSTSNVTSPSDSLTTIDSSSQSKSTTDLTEGSRNRRSSLTNLSLLRTRRSRLIHLMPSASTSSRHPSSISKFSTPTQAHLIRNIEAFLLSFCFSTSPELPAPIAGFAANDADCGKARPYVMPMNALAEVLQVQSRDGGDEIDGEGEDNGKGRSNAWSLAELILSGALEGESEFRASSGLRSGANTERSSKDGDKGKGRQVESDDVIEEDTAWMAHRAWVGSVREIVIADGSSARTKRPSQPSLPSQSHSRSYSNHSRIPSQSQVPPSRVQATSYSKPVQSLDRADPVLNTQFPTSASSASAALYIDTKRRRASKKRGYQSLAIEKRLPTPPEDENEDEELEEDYGMEVEAGDVDSTISNATSCTQSPYPDDDYAERDATPRASEWVKDSFANGRVQQQPLETTGSYDYSKEYHHQRYGSYPDTNNVANPSSGYPSASSSSDSTPSTITSSHPYLPATQHHQPERILYSQAYAQGNEKFYGETHQQKNEYLPDTSLPTPPDSDKASLEGVVPDPVAPSASAHHSSRERDRERKGASAEHNYVQASLSEHEYSRSREVNQHSVQNIQSHSADKDRERRKRTYSQPTRPPPPVPIEAATSTSQAVAVPITIDERVPPHRSKTRPREKERRVSKDYPPLPLQDSASKSATERRIPHVSAILNKPLRPDLRHSPASEQSSSSGERERERRHGKLGRKLSKPDIKSRGKSKGSEGRDRERERRESGGANAGSRASAIKRVPVPAMRDALPALPRHSTTQTPPQFETNAPQASSSRMARSASEVASGAQQYHQDHHTKWKFWKGGAGTGAVVNT